MCTAGKALTRTINEENGMELYNCTVLLLSPYSAVMTGHVGQPICNV